MFNIPKTVPPAASAAILAERHRTAKLKACVDYGLYGLLGEETIDRVTELAAAGVICFKLYMDSCKL